MFHTYERRRFRQRLARSAGRAGVTLLELVMVIVVVGIILGLSLPLASGLVGKFRSGSARDVFVNYYARARAVAIQYGREGRLHIEAAKARFWVETDTGRPGATAADTIGLVLDVAREYGGVTMYSTRRVLCFDSRGLPFTDSKCEPHDAAVVFARSDRADTVQLSLGGTVVRK